MAAFENLSTSGNNRILPLAVLQPWPFFDPIKWHFTGAAIGGKHGGVFEKIDRVVTPFPCDDHATINIQYSIKLDPLEARARSSPPAEYLCPALWITPCLAAGRSAGENYGLVAHQLQHDTAAWKLARGAN
jgi:hypothetical protein